MVKKEIVWFGILLSNNKEYRGIKVLSLSKKMVSGQKRWNRKWREMAKRKKKGVVGEGVDVCN